ncbi:hypothetical protein V7114_06965 [Neobacillus niacini]|uniref:hypothetical protein n=1 Tax=Neobacillus niacini TaxID=86668 RepID=UPI0030005F68
MSKNKFRVICEPKDEHKGAVIMKCPICGCGKLEDGISVTPDGEVFKWVICTNCDWIDEVDL